MPRKKMDVRGEEVEKWKLTKEQMSFQKRFALLKDIQALLEGRSLALALQARNEQELWESLEGEFMKLQPPQKALHELPGMDFEAGSRPSYNLRY